MILRRMAEAVREQNWFTVIIEVVVVVLGVFIGIQVDDWNSQRQTRAEEKRLASQLLDELTTAIATKETWIAETEVQWHMLKDAIKVVQSKDLTAQLTDEQCGASWSSHIIFFGNSALATLDELLLNGGIRALKDAELRSALLNFSATQGAGAQQLAYIRSDFTNLIDNHADAFLRTLTETPSFSPSQNLQSQFVRSDGRLPFYTAVTCQLDKIRADQTVRNKLISNLGRTTGVLSSAKAEVHLMEQLQKRLLEMTP